MRRDLAMIAAGAAFAVAAAANADPSVTLPFTLNTTVGGDDSATSALTLDAAPGYDYTFEITSITLHATLFGGPVPLDPVALGDVDPASLIDAGGMASIPSMLFTGHYDSAANATYPTGFDFDVTYEALASGALRTNLHVNSLGTYSSPLLTPTSVTVTGVAMAEVIPAPAAGLPLLAGGLLVTRRRRR